MKQTRKPTYLSNFNIIRPAYEGTQAEAIKALAELRLILNPQLNRETVEARIQKYGRANSQIIKRGTEILDFIKPLQPNIECILFEDGKVSPLNKRMEFYKKKVMEIFDRWYDHIEKKPDHLLHVTCTGYVSPNAAQAIAARWEEEKIFTQITNVYHMGCYASLPAIRIARGFCLSSDDSLSIDIAHNEICTLHFDPSALTPEQIVVQSLFADGHIKYNLSDKKPQLGFEVCSLNERTLPDSMDLMTWQPGPNQFNMTLSREVPLRIAPVLKNFVDDLLDQAGIANSTPIYYAIHPGGPRIIEGVEMLLDISEQDTLESHEILAECGNMSSGTLPHIWDRILKNNKRENGGAVVSLGFGPGLTLSGSVFKICR